MQPGDFEALASSSSSGAPRPPEPKPPGAEPGPAQSRMENFRKVKTSEEERPPPFPDLPPGVVEMRVKEGSKIRNLMGFAMARMGREATRQIVFSGCGRAVTKTVTCVEIMKRKLGGLHQVTKVQYRTLLEVWEDQEPRPEGRREHLTVPKNVPAISILLSKDPLDPSQLGYQPPDTPGGRWVDEEEEGPRLSPQSLKRKSACEGGEGRPAKKPPRQVPGLQEDLRSVAGC